MATRAKMRKREVMKNLRKKTIGGMGRELEIGDLGIKFGSGLTTGEEDDVVEVEFVVGKVDDGGGEGGHLVGQGEVSVVVVLVV